MKSKYYVYRITKNVLPGNYFEYHIYRRALGACFGSSNPIINVIIFLLLYTIFFPILLQWDKFDKVSGFSDKLAAEASFRSIYRQIERDNVKWNKINIVNSAKTKTQ